MFDMFGIILCAPILKCFVFFPCKGIKSTNNEISKPFPPEMKDEIFRQKLCAQMDRALDSFIVRSGGPRFFDRRHSELQTADEHGYVPR